MFLWKLAKNILPVAERLQKNTTCVQCSQGIETVQHLLFQCSVTSEVWSVVSPENLQDATKYGDVNQWLQSWMDKRSLFSSKRQHLRNLAVITMWFLWKSRWLKLFEGKSQSPTIITQQIFQFCYAYGLCIHNSYIPCSYISNHISIKPRNDWIPPSSDWLKLNFDVSILPDTNFVGFSIVLRNHLGDCLEAVAWTRNVRDVDQAEVLAMLRVLQWLKFKGLCKVQVEGDNKSVMEAMNKNQSESIR
ncbi:uncharacterized protein LOC113351268 [Papaver somniferum]|uniref:uncharacterized protein LOC113351268 n=1 Tax=Papaver somniferum TaxID=3469 RepID=UPI000E6F558C|nr:uncharacterized protein LOC113351268 [Papaver somniferum]